MTTMNGCKRPRKRPQRSKFKFLSYLRHSLPENGVGANVKGERKCEGAEGGNGGGGGVPGHRILTIGVACCELLYVRKRKDRESNLAYTPTPITMTAIQMPILPPSRKYTQI